jgi:hypothetical protein
MKQVLSILLFLMCTSVLFSQEGFKNGLVLLTQQDTLYGLVENNTGYQNSIICNFQRSIGDSVVQFAPKEIYGYYFNDGKFYVSKEIENQWYFFEYLIEGKLNIYLKQDRDLSNHYFIAKDTLPFRELTFKAEITVDDDGIQRVSNSKTHNLLLSYYTNDYPQLKQAAMSIEKPSNSSLIKFAKDYHNATCVDGPCIIYEKKSKTILELEVTGGISSVFLAPPRYTSATTFVTGNLMVNIMVPKISESAYFGFGLGYFRYPERIVLDKEFRSIDVYGDSTFNYTYGTKFQPKLQIPITVFYNNHRRGLSPILGLSTNILYLFDYKAFCGINYQINLMAIKLYGEFGKFPTENNQPRYTGIRLSIGYLLK